MLTITILLFSRLMDDEGIYIEKKFEKGIGGGSHDDHKRSFLHFLAA